MLNKQAESEEVKGGERLSTAGSPDGRPTAHLSPASGGSAARADTEGVAQDVCGAGLRRHLEAEVASGWLATLRRDGELVSTVAAWAASSAGPVKAGDFRRSAAMFLERVEAT